MATQQTPEVSVASTEAKVKVLLGGDVGTGPTPGASAMAKARDEVRKKNEKAAIEAGVALYERLQSSTMAYNRALAEHAKYRQRWAEQVDPIVQEIEKLQASGDDTPAAEEEEEAGA